MLDYLTSHNKLTTFDAHGLEPNLSMLVLFLPAAEYALTAVMQWQTQEIDVLVKKIVVFETPATACSGCASGFSKS